MLLLRNFKLKFLLGPLLSCFLLEDWQPVLSLSVKEVSLCTPEFPGTVRLPYVLSGTLSLQAAHRLPQKHSQGPVLTPIMSGHRPPSLHHLEKTLRVTYT